MANRRARRRARTGQRPIASSTRSEQAVVRTADLLADLPIPDDLRPALADVLNAADVAKLQAMRAGGTPEDADIGKVKALLAGNMRLVRWLNRAERMVYERTQAEQAGRSGYAYTSGGSPEGLRDLDIRAGMGSTIGAAGSHTIDSASLEVWASPTGRVTGTGSRYDSASSLNSYKNAADGVDNSGLLRTFSLRNPWVRAAINERRNQVGRATLEVIPRNELKPYNRTLAREIQRLIDQPNEGRQNRRELLESVVEDILVLDRGVISKNQTVERRPVALYAEDGATIRIYSGWTGNPAEPRYLFVNPSNNTRTPLRNDQIIMFIDNPATYRTGLSPVMVLKEIIEADLKATQSAMHMVDMKPPPMIVQLPGAQDAQVRGVRDYYDTEVAGRKEAFFLGGEAEMKVEKMVFSARENQWMEWQEYLCRKIAVIFKFPASFFGINFDRGAQNANPEHSTYDDAGLLALMTLMEEYLNRELLGDFAPHLALGRDDIDSLNLKIVFPQVGEINRQLHAERAADIAAKGLVQLPSFTLNQVLSMRGEQLVSGGNTYYVNTSLGPVPWLSYDGNIANYNPLSAMAGLNDDGSDGPNPNASIGGGVKPKVPQPGSPPGQSNDPQTPPKKPRTAPTPRDAAGQSSAPPYPDDDLGVQQRAWDRHIVYDGRDPGRVWTPSTRAYRAILDDPASGVDPDFQRDEDA